MDVGVGVRMQVYLCVYMKMHMLYGYMCVRMVFYASVGKHVLGNISPAITIHLTQWLCGLTDYCKRTRKFGSTTRLLLKLLESRNFQHQLVYVCVYVLMYL